jgi:hypothetical protein
MPCQLQPVVQLLCEEVELSFLEAGRPCPPWREWAATINRWMSDQYVDIIVPEPTATDDEVVEFITRCCQFNGAAAGPGSAAGNSGASASTTSTCSPVNLNQQRLQDKMHVSSVLSSASTSSRRCVPEPLHKQLGFSAVAEDESAAQLLPTTLRDASFTSVSSDASAESVQMLSEAQAAAKAAEAAGKPLGIAARSLSVPSAELLSSSADSGSVLDCECFDVLPSASQQQQSQMPSPAGDQQACNRASSSSRHASSAAEHKPAGQPHAGRSKSLLTAHMQLKAHLQQQQQRMLFPAASAACLGQQVQVAPQLRQQVANATMMQQVAPQQQLLLQQLQLQHQQMLAQHMAMQQQQQGLHSQLPQQLAVLQQRCSQPSQQQRPGLTPMQQQQQLVAPLLPVVHTVRPCGVATAAPVSVAQPVLQQQQQQPRQLLMQMQQQLHAVQLPAQQEQPRLLRLIQRK